MTTPSIRTGFPVVATAAAAAPPYNILTAAFSANAGDELLAVAIGAGLPTVVSRNAGDTAAGALNWVLRFVVRQDYKNTTLNVLGAYQVAFYTAIVPPGGVTERALYVTNTVANDGGSTVTGSVPARLMVVAADNTNGIGAIAFKGSIATNANSNDITTGQAAIQTIKPFGNASLLLSAGWFSDGTAPAAAAGCTEVVAPGTDRMPLYSKTGGAAGVATALGSSITDGSLWALGVIEYLPTDQPKPSRKILFLGDSGIESTHSTYQIPVSVQDNLAPHFEVFGQGVWWAHLPQQKARWDAEKATLPVMDVAIVQCGGNDLADGGYTWTTAMETALAAVYADLEAAGIPIAAGTLFGPDVGAGAPAGYYDMRDWITANVPAGTHLYSHQIVSDPATNYLTMLAAYQAADGSHVNATGNAIFGANISAWIETLGLVQTAIPDADISTGAWTPSTGATLYGVLVAGDGDYISTTSNSTTELGLVPLDTPDAGPQVLTYRAAGSAAKALKVGLYRGATLHEEWTTDPLAAAVTEYVRTITTAVTDVSDLRVQITAQDAAAPPTPTVTFGAIGTGANGSTTVAPSYPTGITAGQYLTCVVTSGATNSETPTTPGGWTLLGTGASTDGAYGIDTGPRRATVFGKTADGTETGTLTVSITNGGTCRGTISRWTKSQASYAWDVVGAGANDSTSGTGVSMATAAINWAAGDCAMVATGQRVDSATQSAQSLTASGTTFGTRTNRAATAVTTGNDHRHTVDTFAAVTTGGGSAATTWAYTASASVSAGGVVVRLREVPPTEFSRVTSVEFKVPSGSGGGGLSLQPPLLANTSTLFAPVVTPGSVSLQPPLLSNASTLFAPVVVPPGVMLQPGIMVNTSTLFAPTVSAGGITLQPGLLTNTSTLLAPVVTPGGVMLQPGILVNTSTLFAPTVSAGGASLQPPLLANTSTLFAPGVTPGGVTLQPPLLSNASTLFAPVVVPPGVTLQTGILANTSTLFAPTVSAGGAALQPPLLANTSTLVAPVVTPGGVVLQPGILVNTSTLFAPTVSAGGSALQPPLLANTSTLFAPVVTPGGVTLQPGILVNTSMLFSPVISDPDAIVYTRAPQGAGHSRSQENTTRPERSTGARADHRNTMRSART